MTASLVFDVIIVLIGAIIIIKNAVRGFVKSFVTFARSILAILVAYIFSGPLAGLLNEKIFTGIARGWIYDAFCSTRVGENQYALYQIFDGIPDWFTRVTVSSGVEDWMVQEYFQNNQNASLADLEIISNNLGEALGGLLSTIVAFLLIFIIMEIIIALLGALLNKLAKLPMIRVVNVLLGALIGAVIAFVVGWIIAVCVNFVVSFGSSYYPDIFKPDIISCSTIMKFLLEHDIWTWAKNAFLN